MTSTERVPRRDHCVFILAPTRRDGEVTRNLLAKADVVSELFQDLPSLVAALDDGVGAVMVTDLVLTDPDFEALLAALSRQPEWSDVPVLVLSRGRDVSPRLSNVFNRLTLTLLDRPVSIRSMVSAVLAALRARRRQFQIRDHLLARAKAEQALRDADRRKDEFLATLAHELRNPLAPIRTGLQVLNRLPGETPQATRVRAMMDRQLEQLVKLINDLLDVSRISTGKVVLQRERVDLRQVIDTAIEGSQPLIDAGRHQVKTLTPAEPVWVVGDAARLSQVVGNLLNNAAKYTAPGGRIEVAVRREDGEAFITVSDNGAGLPGDMLEHVFEMFTQLGRTRDRAQEGLGIGLSLVRRLVELHGGTVKAASPGLDRGSTFTICLPAVEAALARPLSPGATAEHARPHRCIRVLVVDDNVDAADALAIQLETSGHQTRTEYSGKVALETAREFQPEVVFCDLGMAGMDGLEVAQRLRADRRHAATVLVALTGWGSEEDKRRTHNTGFDFHLVKPVSADAVDEILSRL